MEFEFHFICLFPDDLLSGASVARAGYSQDNVRGVEFARGSRFFVRQLIVSQAATSPEIERQISNTAGLGGGFWILGPESIKPRLCELLDPDFKFSPLLPAPRSMEPLLRKLFISSMRSLEGVNHKQLDAVKPHFFFLESKRHQEVKMKANLSQLKKISGSPSAILGRGDFTYDLLLHLVRVGGEISLKAAAKLFLPPKLKISQFESNLRAYFHYGDPFERIGLTQSDWPCAVVLEIGQPELIRASNLEALAKGFSLLGENVPPVNWVVDHTKYTYSDIVRLSRQKKAKIALSDPFHSFFKSRSADAVGRKSVTALPIKDKKSPQAFAVIGPFWEMVVSVDIGPKNLDYAAGEREVVNAWKLLQRRSKEDRFISEENFFSLLVAREFGSSAWEAIGIYDRVVPMAISDFMRLAQYIDTLDSNQEQLACWGFFMLQEIGARDSMALVDTFIERVNEQLAQ